MFDDWKKIQEEEERWALENDRNELLQERHACDGLIDDCPGLEPKNSWWCDACSTFHPNADVNACPEFDKLPFEGV